MYFFLNCTTWQLSSNKEKFLRINFLWSRYFWTPCIPKSKAKRSSFHLRINTLSFHTNFDKKFSPIRHYYQIRQSFPHYTTGILVSIFLVRIPKVEHRTFFSWESLAQVEFHKAVFLDVSLHWVFTLTECFPDIPLAEKTELVFNS